jgi:hypothetical protein
MTKKILLGVFILLIGAVSIIAYNFYKNVKKPVSTSSIIAVPQNAALILQENNFSALYKKLSSTNIIWEELVNNTSSTKIVNEQIHYFDSIINQSFKPLAKQPVLTSAHLSGANNFDFIFYINISYNFTKQELIQKIKNTTHTNPTSRVYDDVNIYTSTIKNNKKIAFTFYKNIFAFSYSTVLIEDVIRQLNSKTSLKSNSSFAKILNTSGQAEDGNIYINNTIFSKIVNQFISPEAKNYTNNLGSYANWTELDIKTKPNSIMLNGFTLSKSNDKFLSLFKNQQPQQNQALDITPSNVAFFYHYGFSDAKAFFDQRKQLLKSKNQFFNYQKFIDQQNENYGIDIEEELLNNIGNELAVVITEPLTTDFIKNQFIIFKAKDLDKTITDLENMALKINDEPYHFENFNELPIHKIDLKNVFSQLFGKPFFNISSPYYTIIDNFIIFSQTESAIKTFISDYTNNKTLAKNENFQNFSDNLSSDANLSVYINIARSVNLFKAYGKKDFAPLFDEKLELFRKFEAIAFQVNTEKNNLYYNNIYLKYNPIYKQDTRSLWELQLDTTINSEPQLVKNHKSGAKEIFVQDEANKIYLISNTGKVIWSKQLQSKIIGKTHQIDVYKNNKLQLLFNTKNKIYLLDRNGNNVEKYPIKLNSEATNNVTPLDYSKTRDYRILIGCANNMVYNYNIQGDLVKGWEYQAATSFANQEMWHFALKNKDYIVIPLQNGQVKVVERSGRDRLSITEKLAKNSKQVFLKVGRELNKTYVTSIDTNGLVTKVYLNNKKEEILFDEITAGSSFRYANNQFVFNNNNNLIVFDSEKNKIYELELETNITNSTIAISKDKIGVIANNSIYLINNSGNIEKGFPLAGSTPFNIADINNDKTLNIVVGDGNKIVTYNLEE